MRVTGSLNSQNINSSYLQSQNQRRALSDIRMHCH